MADYKARFNCPGCGSSLLTLEGAISLRCSFCGLVMRIGAPGRILKYYYESRLDSIALKIILEKHLKDNDRLAAIRIETSRLFYLPFYRFRGMSYSLISEKKLDDEQVDLDQEFIPSKIIISQRCRHFDLTIPAFENRAFGLDSLGVRPEVIPLSIFSREILPAESIPIDIAIPPNDAKRTAVGMSAYNLSLALEGKELIISEMIGEGLSIIYYPIWALATSMSGSVSTFFLDGLSRKIITETQGIFEYHAGTAGLAVGDDFKPVPHRCPNCGADLPVSEVSLVYYCSNCHKSYVVESNDNRFTATRSARFEKAENSYPFWRFQFNAGNGEKVVGEFARILTGEIPLIDRNKANNPFYFYIPAFKTSNLETMTARAIRLNRTQPILELIEDEIAPAAEVILPESEAIELARFYWQVMRSKYRHLNTPVYDFRAGKIGHGELLWLTMADSNIAAQASQRAVNSRAR